MLNRTFFHNPDNGRWMTRFLVMHSEDDAVRPLSDAQETAQLLSTIRDIGVRWKWTNGNGQSWMDAKTGVLELINFVSGVTRCRN